MARNHSFWLGFFTHLNGHDSVLLECATPEHIISLSALLAAIHASEQPVLPVHVFARLAPAHQVRLFATRTSEFRGEGFQWVCSTATLPSIRTSLTGLAERGAGHVLFELASTHVQLIVACREYGREWWLAQG